jgi:hypothetical protein
MSRSEALLCDMHGVAWDRLLDDANRLITPDIHGKRPSDASRAM